MSNNYCFYHPKRNAIKKCEFCGKDICFSCRMTYRKKSLYNQDSYSINLNRKKACCPVCFHILNINYEKDQTAYYLFFGLPFSCLILFICNLIFLWMLSKHDGSKPFEYIMTGIFLVGFSIFFIFGLIYEIKVGKTKKIKKVEIDLDKFIEETGMSSSIVFKNPYYCGKFKKF